MDQKGLIDLINCPITKEPMIDPISGSDGHTYERSAIITYLSLKTESPLTRQPMTISDLKINYSIKSLCDKYHNGQFNNIEKSKFVVECTKDEDLKYICKKLLLIKTLLLFEVLLILLVKRLL